MNVITPKFITDFFIRGNTVYIKERLLPIASRTTAIAIIAFGYYTRAPFVRLRSIPIYAAIIGLTPLPQLMTSLSAFSYLLCGAYTVQAIATKSLFKTFISISFFTIGIVAYQVYDKIICKATPVTFQYSSAMNDSFKVRIQRNKKDEFEITQQDGKEIELGKEVVSRVDTVRIGKIYFTEMIKMYERKLSRAKITSAIQDLREKESLYQNELKKLQEYEKVKPDWFTCKYFRELISNSSFMAAVSNYISAPINMRFHELLIGEKRTAGFFRIGVISDMRNGWFSLEDLSKMTQKPEIIKETIHVLTEKLSKKNNSNRQESLNYALQILHDNIEKALQDRRETLLMPMMQLIIGQIEENIDLFKEALNNNEPFSMVHISLLNPTKEEFDLTGWMHNERVEIEDMQYMFRYFRGKKIVCDGSGPRIDDDKIFLPYFFSDIKNREVPLNSLFFNVSVQGHSDANHLKINKEALSFLEEKYQLINKNEKIKKSFTEKETHYIFACELLLSLLLLNKIAISIGCLSAKDRTGVVSYCVIQCFIATIMKNLGLKENNPFANPFDPNRSPIKICLENDPHFKALKVDTSQELPGVSTMNRIDGTLMVGIAHLRRITQ